MSRSWAVTDLDGTLVFSGEPDPDRVVLETYESGREGQMAKRTHGLWQSLAATGRLVVATTRTRDQFRRLQVGTPVPLALVANGFHLLVDGLEDARWSAMVATLVMDDASLAEVHHAVGQALSGADVRRWVVSDDAFVTVLARDADAILAVRDRVDAAISGTGWVSSQTGRKLYVLPRALDKGDLVQRLLADLGSDGHIAGGDSDMDATMVCGATRGIAPRGSPLATLLAGRSGISITRSAGVEAGAEVLDAYADFLGVTTSP